MPRRDGGADVRASLDRLRWADRPRSKPDLPPLKPPLDAHPPPIKPDHGPPDAHPPPKPDVNVCPPGYSCGDKGLPSSCVVDADCAANPSAKFCNTAVGLCVECKTDADCGLHPGTKFCHDTGRCVACKANTDCASSPWTPACQVASGTCVAWCVAWRQTGACSATGPREPWNDKGCGAFIDSGWSGYCECANQSIGADCGHPVNTCASVCATGSW